MGPAAEAACAAQTAKARKVRGVVDVPAVEGGDYPALVNCTLEGY